MNAPITDAGDVKAQGGTLSTSDTEPFYLDDVATPRRTASDAAPSAPPAESGRPRGGDPLPEGVDPFTDLGNAYRIVRAHGEGIRYCDELGGWLIFDGKAWRRDEAAAHRLCIDVSERLMRFALTLYRRAQGKEEQDHADEYVKWARKSQNEPAIRRALELAKSLKPIATTSDAWDLDPWLLNCSNGTLNLHTLELQPHRREDFITKLAPVPYVSDARSPRFDSFIGEVLPLKDVRDFVQRFLGYSLTGSTREQCFVVALGPGANGKSVLAETVRSVLGNDYTRDTPTDTLMQSKQTRGTENDIARLRAARFVTAKETEESKRLDEARVKALTGGDTVTARFLFREHFEYLPQFKLWLYCNHRPVIRGTDDGIWRRIMLVAFDVTIPPERRDTELPAKLQAEREGILAWMVRGCFEWQRSGLRPPDAVSAATKDWRAESDDIGAFIQERCVVAPFAKVTAGAIYAAFREWATNQGEREPISAKAFGMRLAARGFEASRTKTSRNWEGIGLQATDENTNDYAGGDG